MTEQDQSHNSSFQTAPSSTLPLVLACFAVVAVAYIGFVRPAQAPVQQAGPCGQKTAK